MATHVFSWCFRRMLQVFQLFQMYVASVSSRCCQSRSWFCTCCSGTHLQQPPTATVGPACMHVGVVGCYGAGVGHGEGVGHGATRAPHEADPVGAGIRTLAPPGRPGARCSDDALPYNVQILP